MKPIDLKLFLKCAAHAEIRGVSYQMGSKCPDPHCDSVDLPAALDCSGFAQWLMVRQGFNDFPEGTAYDGQRPWFVNQGLSPLNDYQAIMTSTGLYVCFIASVAGGHAGHVWFVTGGSGGNVIGRTIECHGGAGVTSRHADYPVLVSEFAVGFEVPAQ